MRRARSGGLPAIVAMLADDPLGAARESPGERGAGLGTRLVRWAVEDARRRGRAVVRLPSDAGRADAHRFYERLGVKATHMGFTLTL